jgi:adenylate cyclase
MQRRDLSLRMVSKAAFTGVTRLIYQFEGYSLDVDRQELRCGTELVDVEPQVLDLLQYVIRQRERVVSKDDLIEHVWHGRIVSESTLGSRINAARQAIGDSGDHQRLIRTIARKGIRFVGEVRGDQNPPTAGSGTGTMPFTPGATAPRLPDKPSIAVLPFTNMSGDPEQEYFADGMAEEILTALSHCNSLFVIARNSSFTYKGKAIDVRQVGRELGVRYVLEGSVRRAGDSLRVTAQLVDATSGAQIWADRFDGGISDVFKLQDRITEQVAGALQPSIRIAEIERSRRKRPQDLGAYDYTMRAMPHVWVLEKEESAKALELLDQALAIDPEYPLALSLAGWCHAQCSVYNWADDIAASQALARKFAERAAELSGDDPFILAVLGTVHTLMHNHGTARVLLERALALDPNSAWAWSRLGWLETYTDRPERAIENFERALRLSPLDPMNFNNHVGLGAAHEVAQDYDKAVANYRRALEERPHAMWIYRNLAASLCGAGRMEEAREAYAELMRNYPTLTSAKFRQAMVFSAPTLDRMVDNLRKLGLPD